MANPYFIEFEKYFAMLEIRRAISLRIFIHDCHQFYKSLIGAKLLFPGFYLTKVIILIYFIVDGLFGIIGRTVIDEMFTGCEKSHYKGDFEKDCRE